MLTVINNGAFTGVQYLENKDDIRAFHAGRGEICIWYADNISGVTITQSQLLAYHKESKKSDIQAEKKAVRDGGVTVSGVLYDTDSAAREAYHGFALELAGDETHTTANWRPSSGTDYTTMTKSLYDAIWTAYTTMKDAVCAWQVTQDAAVDAATTIAEVMAISAVYTE